MSDNPETLLTFPCEFPIKIFGQQLMCRREIIDQIINEHVAKEDLLDVRENKSSGKKFIAYTVTINAQSQTQLDNIYQSLTQEASVVMAL